MTEVDAERCSVGASVGMREADECGEGGNAISREEGEKGGTEGTCGGEDMFGMMFTCHSQDVFTYFLRRVGPEEAEDLTAETFLQAWLARGSYKASRGTCGQWVYGIAHNVLRRRWRDGERADRAMLRLRMRACADRLDEDEEQLVERVVATELAPGLQAGLDKLSEMQRKVVLEHVLRDVPFEELAERLGYDASSVRSSLHRARRHLANALATWEEAS